MIRKIKDTISKIKEDVKLFKDLSKSEAPRVKGFPTVEEDTYQSIWECRFPDLLIREECLFPTTWGRRSPGSYDVPLIKALEFNITPAQVIALFNFDLNGRTVSLLRKMLMSYELEKKREKSFVRFSMPLFPDKDIWQRTIDLLWDTGNWDIRYKILKNLDPTLLLLNLLVKRDENNCAIFDFRKIELLFDYSSEVFEIGLVPTLYFINCTIKFCKSDDERERWISLRRYILANLKYGIDCQQEGSTSGGRYEIQWIYDFMARAAKEATHIANMRLFYGIKQDTIDAIREINEGLWDFKEATMDILIDHYFPNAQVEILKDLVISRGLRFRSDISKRRKGKDLVGSIYREREKEVDEVVSHCLHEYINQQIEKNTYRPNRLKYLKVLQSIKELVW